MKLEKYFIESDYVAADEKYITDGHILVLKRFSLSGIIQNLKTEDDIFLKIGSVIPFEKGKEFSIGTGSKCELLRNKTIGITYNNRYLFDYEFVKKVFGYLPYYGTKTFVVENSSGVPLLKFFVNDEFAGLIMPIDKELHKKVEP